MLRGFAFLVVTVLVLSCSRARDLEESQQLAYGRKAFKLVSEDSLTRLTGLRCTFPVMTYLDWFYNGPDGKPTVHGQSRRNDAEAQVSVTDISFSGGHATMLYEKGTEEVRVEKNVGGEAISFYSLEGVAQVLTVWPVIAPDNSLFAVLSTHTPGSLPFVTTEYGGCRAVY